MYRIQESEIKLDILESLSRSQRAIARILESIAGITEVSQGTAIHLANHIQSIQRVQSILARKISGIHIGSIKRGTAAKPWLNNEVNVKCLAKN